MTFSCLLMLALAFSVAAYECHTANPSVDTTWTVSCEGEFWVDSLAMSHWSRTDSLPVELWFWIDVKNKVSAPLLIDSLILLRNNVGHIIEDEGARFFEPSKPRRQRILKLGPSELGPPGVSITRDKDGYRIPGEGTAKFQHVLTTNNYKRFTPYLIDSLSFAMTKNSSFSVRVVSNRGVQEGNQSGYSHIVGERRIRVSR
jgi:hypothetical protein